MRYPLVFFLVLFVIPPFALHALLTGRATVDRPTALQFHVLPQDTDRVHNWTLAGSH